MNLPIAMYLSERNCAHKLSDYICIYMTIYVYTYAHMHICVYHLAKLLL